MAYLNWSESLSVKVQSMDDQHKKLIELINEFYENIKNHSNDDNISTLISGMKKYTQLHFNTEEALMKKHDYPTFEEHKKEHDLFISKVTSVEEKFNSGKLIVSFEITGFLKDWLKNHIQGTDKKYSDFLNQKGVK